MPAKKTSEIAALIETLRKTDLQLDELTASEVDAVTDRDGQAFFLQPTQDRLRFRSLTDLTSDWYWEQDEEYRFLSFSESGLGREFGRSQSSLIGKRRWEVPGVTPLQGGWPEHMALLDARKPFRNFEYRSPLENGGFRYLASSGEPVFDADGRFKGYRGVGTDISESQHAKAEILRLNDDLERRVKERTAELEAANRELEAFDYSVAHDLRAPIRHIEGFCSMLLEDYGDQLGMRGRECLEKVQAAGKRMELLVGDLLALSLISRCTLNRTDVDASALAQIVFANLQEGEPERDVECVITPGICTNADIGQLRIVLENLIGNAWKFTGKQRGAKIKFGCARQNDAPAFYVRDNGAGFDPGYADRLFAPFQRLHAQSEFKGTGIGLATVSRIITRHGGKVWAEGRVDHGATFHFTLPL